MEIIIAKEWMKRKLTIEEAEAELLGLCNSVKWKTLIARMRKGDELWEFASPNEFFTHKMGRKGIVLISEGKAVDGVLTSMS